MTFFDFILFGTLVSVHFVFDHKKRDILYLTFGNMFRQVCLGLFDLQINVILHAVYHTRCTAVQIARNVRDSYLLQIVRGAKIKHECLFLLTKKWITPFNKVNKCLQFFFIIKLSAYDFLCISSKY